MESFTRLEATAVPLPHDNVDTDAIVPAVSVKRVGADTEALGDFLFYEWRVDEDENPIPDFALNRSEFAGAGIMVGGRNFGCGSSREHAVWALKYAGFRCVVARSYGEIFYNNCFKNGVLPAIVGADDHAGLMDEVIALDGARPLAVDLEAQRIAMPSGNRFAFEVDPAGRESLLRGLDDIAMTLDHENDIAEYQARHRELRPWLYDTRFALGRET